MPNYETKSDLQNATGVDTSKLAEKDNSATLKTTIDELDVDQLKNIPRGTSQLKTKVDKLEVDKLATASVD